MRPEFASRYPTRFLRSYVRMKVAADPVYAAVFEAIRDSPFPLLDLGCGVGVLAFYLRERGYGAPIRGVDHDGRKVGIANDVADGDPGLSFEVGDVREPRPFGGTVVLLDVLHYLTDAEQSTLLLGAAKTANAVVIREAVRDRSWRYRLTVFEETLARASGWLKAERLNFPLRETIEGPFCAAFDRDVRPMFGHTPFNNYLFVFRRSSPGTTKA